MVKRIPLYCTQPYTRDLFYQHGLTEIRECISNYTHNFIYDVITPRLNFYAAGLCMDELLHPAVYLDVITYPLPNLDVGLDDPYW